MYLKDLWPSEREIQETMLQLGQVGDVPRQLRARCSTATSGGARCRVPTGERFEWDDDSTYIRNPPFFEGLTLEPAPPSRHRAAPACSRVLGDSVTTDHISPAGSIPADSPAGKYLIAKGVTPRDFNSYGARRGNHEVMMRGTFANIRLRNQLAPGTEGGWTTLLPEGEVMTIYDASVRYRDAGVPLIIIAGKEYGSGSSRDWAAKGTLLLGVKAVLAESFERIHRSNLVNMGVLPLQFRDGAERRVAQDHRTRALRHHRHGRHAAAARRRHRAGDGRGRHRPGRHGDGADRHAGGARRVPQRRHPAVRRASARQGLEAQLVGHTCGDQSCRHIVCGRVRVPESAGPHTRVAGLR